MGSLYRFDTLRLLRWGLLACFVSASAARADDGLRTIDPARPPGRLVDVGGYRLHIYCQGRGSPAVILDAGLGGFSMDWIYVQSLLREDTRVCSYDRAGYGWSDPGPAPRTSDHIARELSVLLKRAGVEPPYVLVGHSFGGYNVEYFARTFPGSVAGIVLVDASHPEQAERLPVVPGEAHAPDPQRLVTFLNTGVIRTHYPKSLWFPITVLMSSRKAIAAEQAELTGFIASAALVEHAGPLPVVPMTVISRGKRVWPAGPVGDAQERTWKELQGELAASLPGTRHIIARESGHLIHLDQPELVAGAIRDVLRETCDTRLAGGAPGSDLTC